MSYSQSSSSSNSIFFYSRSFYWLRELRLVLLPCGNHPKTATSHKQFFGLREINSSYSRASYRSSKRHSSNNSSHAAKQWNRYRVVLLILATKKFLHLIFNVIHYETHVDFLFISLSNVFITFKPICRKHTTFRNVNRLHTNADQFHRCRFSFVC